MYWKQIKCPFFHSDDTRSILCEGCKTTSVIRQGFKSKEEKIDWQKKYCMQIKGYEKCPIFCVANKKYEV